ncbi:MAG: NADPH-dependent FMN reductase [Actinomycetota bacterium]
MTASSPVTLGAVIGSLREGSFHRIVFENAQELLPDGVSLTEIPIVDLPFFNQDLEGPDGPDSVLAFQAAVDALDGLVFFSPEYNGGVPAVTKNAVDWASRPRGDAPIHGLSVLVVGATPGRHDVPNVREALSKTAQSAGGRVFERSIGLSSISRRIEDRRVDAEIRAELEAALAAFVEFVRTPADTDD